jgi:hypothetical protein
MTPKTLKALRGSIAKWRAIVDGTGTDRGPANCPLCQMFLVRRDLTSQNCDGCPVYQETGLTGCEKTPYDNYIFAEEGRDEPAMADAAADELAFLISLLPDGEQP